MVLSGLISYLDFRVLWFHVDKSQWQIFALGNRGSWRGKDGWDPMAWPSGTLLACGAAIKKLCDWRLHPKLWKKMWSPLVGIHLFQPPSLVCISIIITQLHVTIHYRPLCAASIYF